jgi:hypothetical protein
MEDLGCYAIRFLQCLAGTTEISRAETSMAVGMSTSWQILRSDGTADAVADPSSLAPRCKLDEAMSEQVGFDLPDGSILMPPDPQNECP